MYKRHIFLSYYIEYTFSSFNIIFNIIKQRSHTWNHCFMILNEEKKIVYHEIEAEAVQVQLPRLKSFFTICLLCTPQMETPNVCICHCIHICNCICIQFVCSALWRWKLEMWYPALYLSLHSYLYLYTICLLYTLQMETWNVISRLKGT